MTRQNPAQGLPAAGIDFAAFPRTQLSGERVLARAHKARYGPGWFSSDCSGRFDLPGPAGTCYAADDLAVSLRECFGTVLTASGYVTPSDAERQAVSTVKGIRGTFASVSEARAAAFGVTAELTSMTPYTVPQEWARLLHESGFGGIRYAPRFTPGPPSAWAIFGAAGSQPLGEVVEMIPGLEACRRAGVPVLTEPPGLGELRRVRGAR
ncbi:RES family NAD+ phosphorylase [Agromyces silvae]|uniref:RES family NAD+ phosphorylase n=1 Tax=Agromyces silvae TaxID=3388266 RepID=UPI0035A0EDD3